MSDYIFGRNSVLALLRTSPDRVFKIMIAEGVKPDPRLGEIRDLTTEHKLRFQIVPRNKIDALAQNTLSPDEQRDGVHATHQGVLASVSPKKLFNLYELEAQCKEKIQNGEQPLVLALDAVTDPRNFGAILRVADASGVDCVLISKQHSAGFGPVVSKTASGAETTMDVAVVPNLTQALKQLKELGFWVVGAANTHKSVDYHKQSYDMPTILVMGSEGKGIGSLITKQCDFLVKIPMLGTVDSLNVATATAVLLFDMRARFPKTR